ncbi:MAG: hypothetical protein ACRDHK_13030 [Actinomycetota bacterium]
MSRPIDDQDLRYEALFDEAIDEAEADGTPLAIPSAVDRVLDRHHVGADRAARWRDRMVGGLRKLVEFPCPADLGPTLRCRFMDGHEDEGLPHEPLRWTSDPLIQEIEEYLYLLEADPEARP